MAPRAQMSKKAVVGTLLAERLLDIAVIVTLFVVVGYWLLGEVGAGVVEWIALATAVVVGGGAIAVVLVRRNERLHALTAPILSSTLQLRGRHGLTLLALTLLIWALEAGVWMSVGAAAGFGMNPIEGCYLVALASVFALIPSGPGYAGTQDAAAITGILALGGTESQAVTYLILVRFVIVVPITLVGPRAAGRPLRRAAAPARRAMRRRGLELLAYAVLVAAALAVRLIALDDRPFHHDESQDAYFSWLFFTRGGTSTSRSCTGRCASTSPRPMYLVFGDSDFTARLAPALMGTLMVPLPYLLRAQLGRVAAFTAAVALAFGPDLPVLQPLRARGHLHRLHHAAAARRSRSGSSTGRAATSRR